MEKTVVIALIVAFTATLIYAVREITSIKT
jgi:hypothetical protein